LKSYIVVTVVASMVNYFSLHSNNFCFSFIRYCDWISNSWQVEIFAFHLFDSKEIKLLSWKSWRIFCNISRTHIVFTTIARVNCISRINCIFSSANAIGFEIHAWWKL